MSARAFRPILSVTLTLAALVVGAAARADDKPSTTAVKILNLDQAIHFALEHQPNVKAARASLASTQVARDAAYSPGAILAGPVVHVRRKQADLGVALAQAAVEEAELSTVHAVTRTYLTVIYAQDQLKVAGSTRDKFKGIRDTAQKLLDSGSKKVAKADLMRIDAYTHLADVRVVEATQGIERAKAALREAIGAPADCYIDFATDTLKAYYDAVSVYCKKYEAHLSCCAAINAALNHRPEIAMAGLFSDIAYLEIDAQKLQFHPYSKTFAATADIHSRVIAATVINEEYRPGALAEEMPVFLAGSRSARMTRASFLADRARIVLDKTRGLIALEVEDACRRLQEESLQVGILVQATEKTAQTVRDADQQYKEDLTDTDTRLQSEGLDAQTRAQLNETYFRYATALAALQRATAGKLWNCMEKLAAEPQGEPIKKMPSTDGPR